ncbi:hypothetical protein DVR14_21610 (plasmid) [Natrinema thermotolerans]|nr:hypothetical protein DVR14_17480 [Natrinema thermotolerans]QCC61235.1 hypothetical protein DVR14_21610 [Natrinema thermotolerans]
MRSVLSEIAVQELRHAGWRAMSDDGTLGTCSRCGRDVLITHCLGPGECYAWPCGCRQPPTPTADGEGT